MDYLQQAMMPTINSRDPRSGAGHGTFFWGTPQQGFTQLATCVAIATQSTLGPLRLVGPWLATTHVHTPERFLRVLSSRPFPPPSRSPKSLLLGS